MKRLNIGLKIWSTNKNYLKAIEDLKAEGFFDYIELFVAPGSSVDHLDIWTEIDGPFILHAPHSHAGLNFSFKENEGQNRDLIREVAVFERHIGARKIIFHPGTNGTIDETIRQINLFTREYPEVFNKAVIENKPKLGLNDEMCIGAAPEEIRRIKDETGCGFCFDVGHMMCFAAWAKRPWIDVMDEFLALRPEIFHLSDGEAGAVYDHHSHFGQGNYDLKAIVSKIPLESYLSVETNKDSKEHLDDFKDDVLYLRRLLQARDELLTMPKKGRAAL